MSAVLDLTCELIRCPSVTPADAGCQALLADRLQAAGFLIEHLRFGDVENLWATHGTDGPVLCLLGHTDVVPPGPRGSWRSDPFAPQIRDGMLYGRGAADMKGSVAAMVCAAEAFVAARPQHPGVLGVLLTSDEEGAAIDGVRAVVQLFRDRGQPIDYCLVGEPSSSQRLGDQVRVGRRGSLTATVTVHGVQGHVALPDKALNPIHAVLPVLHELVARDWDGGSFPEFPPTSLQVANFNAGTGASNVIPGTATVQFNLRYSPRWNADALIQEIETAFERRDVRTTIHWHRSGEPFHTREGRLRDAVREALREQLDIAPDENTGGGTSDGRFVATLGAEVVELGPVNATIHQVDEKIAVDELEKLPDVYLGVIERVLE